MNKRRKFLSALSHASVWFNSVLIGVGIPIVVLLLSNDPVVKINAKEALNVHINLLGWYIVFGLLCFVLIGIPFVAAAGIYNLIMPLVAVCQVASDPDHAYRYPFTLNIIDTRKDRELPPPSTV
jgi:uncharacterized Tic20 family protein